MNLNYMIKIIILCICISFCLCDSHIKNNFRSKRSLTNEAKNIKTTFNFKNVIKNNHKKMILIRGGYKFGLNKLNLSLSTTKIMLQIVLTLFNILCWALPLKSNQFSSNPALLSFANSFSGGIFLMLAFGHLLPEAINALSTTESINSHKALVYTLLGFMVMLFIEKVALNHDHNEIIHEQLSSSIPNVTSNKSNQEIIPNTSSCNNNSGIKSALALCGAMSVHSFFEAAALGLTTDYTSAYMMSICIFLHQPAESLALLIAFLKSGMNKRKIALILSLYSSIAIIGVSIGVIVNSLASSNIEAIVMAITAGTFIYVGATEIASEEFDDAATSSQRYLRYISYCGGIGLMAMIAKYSERFETH